MSKYVESIISAAIKELGVTELNHSNSGERVDQYLAAVGLGPGNPWCAAFCFWCADAAKIPEGTWAGLANKAYCPTIESWARNKGVLSTTPSRGDFMLLQMWDSQGQYSGHIGIVEQVEGNQIFTIEGNTSPQGSGGSDDNGGGVYRRKRSVGSAKYVKWQSLAGDVPTQKVKIFRKPDKATIVVEGKEYTLKSLSINNEPPQPGSTFSIIAEY